MNTENTNAQQPAPSALERRLDLTIAIADLDKDVDARLKRISKNVKMAGFRPGKVPANIVRQQHGDQARHEALNEALDRAFGQAVMAQQLRVAGYPRIEPKNTENSTHLEFAAVFEIYPEVQLGDMSAAEVERPVLEVTEAEIEKTIEILRKQRIRYEAADRAAAKEDRVVIDFLGKKDGEPFQGGQATDYPFVLGQGMMLADFENAVEGLKAGEGKTFDMTFPEDYFSKELAGQKVQFEITVKKVSGPVLPELDAEFAKTLGVPDGDVAKMREEITGNLKREVKKRIQSKIKDQVMDAIIKANPIEIPNALIEMEVHRLMENARRDMEQRGMKINDFPMQPEWFAEQAKRRVTLGLVLAELVKVKELHAKPEQVRAIVDEAAQSYEHPEEVVRWYYAQPQRLQEIEGVAIEDNVVSYVLGVAKVTDKAAAFDELMGQQQA
ncbi:MAG: trigger factor [Pseudomonadota bacterium]|nr:trigger factor [Pseudomonadota bacterium]MDQ5882517.1 trigger factor [Pseudomonadota bacterium]MDQ5904854.1 trigger factor [Pseudomonadota bacterium]MDQ5914875.1 trigger factor [Pseudomonadota bacterium]MDQ5918679.1 trigger factor [Pseudomonadota bacterium]